MIERIRIRILFAVLMPLLLLAMILGMYFISVRVEDAHSNLEVQGLRFAQYLAAASEFNLLSGNREELQTFAENQLGISNLLKALVFTDNTEVVLARAGDRQELSQLLTCFEDNLQCARDANRLFIDHPVFSSGISVVENPELNPDADALERERIGRVAFFYDTQPLLNLQRQLMHNGVLITIFAACLAALVAYLFATGIAGPIRRLSRVVGEIQKGNLSARTRPTGRGELLELERGINSMAVQIEKANENLQQKVEQSTQDLLTTLAQLKLKNRDLEEARNRAEEAGRVKDLFLAKMSHELRTPLASIIGYLKLLEDAQDGAQRRAYGKIVDQASAILLANIDDILDFMRLEDVELRLESIEFYLRDCLRNSVALQKPEASKKRLQLHCEIDESVPETAVGDPARLAQILTNLLSNAIKFTGSGTVKLCAFATPVDDRIDLVVTVSDTGIGIARDKQAQLFEPFVQAEDSINRRYGGSGLGLAIARRLVLAMGGEIGLVSETGNGVEITFNVVLATQLSDVRLVPPRRGPAFAKTVLLVEDNELNRQLLRIQLEAEGVNVSCAENGERALQLACDGTVFDFVLMDVHLPGMDGVALAPELRKLLPECPIFALTANITGSEEQQLLQVGVKRILYKPLDEATLLALLQDVPAQPFDLPHSKTPAPRQQLPPQLVLPRGISSADVLTEFNRLLVLMQESHVENDWRGVFDAAHKLLGSARLFCRGSFIDLVLELEASARDRDSEQLLHWLEKLKLQIAELTDHYHG